MGRPSLSKVRFKGNGCEQQSPTSPLQMLKYSYAYLVKNWLALATLRSKQKIPKSHCLYEQTNFVHLREKDSKFYDNRLVTSM
ncbi:hypothetical protein GQ457_18G013650 [Hibiscus cannabinus]